MVERTRSTVVEADLSHENIKVIHTVVKIERGHHDWEKENGLF